MPKSDGPIHAETHAQLEEKSVENISLTTTKHSLNTVIASGTTSHRAKFGSHASNGVGVRRYKIIALGSFTIR